MLRFDLSAITLKAPPQVSQVVRSVWKFRFKRCAFKKRVAGHRGETFRECNVIYFYCFTGACYLCRAFPIFSVPTGDKGTMLAICYEHTMEPGQVNPGLRQRGTSRCRSNNYASRITTSGNGVVTITSSGVDSANNPLIIFMAQALTGKSLKWTLSGNGCTSAGRSIKCSGT